MLRCIYIKLQAISIIIVAEYLRVNDINRRTFKHWAGLPPYQLLQANCF
jgi:hypothetical protein